LCGTSVRDLHTYYVIGADIRTYTTSYEGLLGRGKAKAGEWVLVHAGAGGVGLAACQIAKAIGCKVIATASTEEKRKVCKDKAGVDATVDYTQDGWQVSHFTSPSCRIKLTDRKRS